MKSEEIKGSMGWEELNLRAAIVVGVFMILMWIFLLIVSR